MKLRDIQNILNASLLAGDDLDYDVHIACGSDLMSDVLAFVKDQGILLTGLVNVQVIRTAEMMDISAIVFVRGKSPDNAMIELAKEKNMTLFKTDLPLYIACGKLYEAGLH